MIKKSEILINFLKRTACLYLGFFILWLFLTCIAYSGTHDPWDGTKWDVASPDIDQPHGNDYKEIYDLRKGVAIRINKEHITLATSSAGGEHKQGSARAFFQDAAPATQVDGTAFVATDLGSLWFDSNASPDNQFNVLTATTPTWTPISTEVIAVLLASNRQFAGTLGVTGDFTATALITANGGLTLGAGSTLNGSSTSNISINSNKFAVLGASGNTVIEGTLGVTGASTFTAGITANGGVTLGAGDDLIGSSTSDITINTNKFTVAGATGNTAVGGTLGVTGNTTVGGTLGVTGASTFTAGITANGGVTLGAGDDLIGSSTSDITINTTKFTVAGATGNTAVGGTLDVTGNIDPTTFETTNGGFKDEDNMASNSATKVASQQSIKAYVDAHGVVQIVNTQTGAHTRSTTAIPWDDTIPQITEGVEVMNRAITPTSAANKLKIDVVVNYDNASQNRVGIAALFQDTTANALAVGIGNSGGTYRDGGCVKFTYYMAAGTTSSTTFRVRIGTDTTAAMDFNGSNNARKFGGVFSSSITITEIKA